MLVTLLATLPGHAAAPAGTTLYSIGAPTDEEQLYLELINRARANPAAEGAILAASTDPEVLRNYQGLSVDLNLMLSQFAQIAPAPPLSMNGQLTAAARLHSLDMLTNAFQAHEGSDGSTFATRAQAQGYPWTTIAENVFAYATSVEEGHAAFEVDWGGDASTGGMQNPPGHRLNIHDPTFREIGVGVVDGVNGKFGPQSVTEDFATAQNSPMFITGVAYYDANGNGAYDLGEGIGGVTVTVNGSAFYAVTAASGGYSVPVSQDGTYTVTLSLAGTTDDVEQVTVAGANVKLDRRLPYVAPTLSGSANPVVGFGNTYSFPSVPGASAYQWQRELIAPLTTVEGAEGGTTNVTVAISPGYSVVDDTVSASGQNSFHLAHPQPDPQILVLNHRLRGRSGTSLSFASMLSWATTSQVAHVQVSTDDGASWHTVWSQAGDGTPGESSFTTQTVPLGDLANQDFTIRFTYDVTGGQFFAQADSAVGWHIDDIAIGNADEILDQGITDIPSGTVFEFTPPVNGTYVLRVRPVVSGHFLPWSTPLTVSAAAGPPPAAVVRATSLRFSGATGAVINFTSSGSSSSQAYLVQSASDPAGPWSTETAAAIQSGSSPGTWVAQVPPGAGGMRFFRIISQ